MSGSHFHVHGPHDHELEHAAQHLKQRLRLAVVARRGERQSLAVLAEHACHGNTGGAPVARDILLAYMQKYHPERIKKDAKAVEGKAPKAEEAPDE